MPTTASLHPKISKTFTCSECEIKKTEKFGPDPLVRNSFWTPDFDGRCHSCREKQEEEVKVAKKEEKREKFLKRAKGILKEAKDISKNVKPALMNEKILLEIVVILLEKISDIKKRVKKD